MSRIIKHPILTEKTASLMESGLYVFAVTRDANKISIRDELKRIYNVDTDSVRVVNLPEKKVTFRRKKGTQGARSKAYVQLKPKQHIPGFESLIDNMKKAAKESAKNQQESVKESS